MTKSIIIINAIVTVVGYLMAIDIFSDFFAEKPNSRDKFRIGCAIFFTLDVALAVTVFVENVNPKNNLICFLAVFVFEFFITFGLSAIVAVFKMKWEDGRKFREFKKARKKARKEAKRRHKEIEDELLSIGCKPAMDCMVFRGGYIQRNDALKCVGIKEAKRKRK